MFNMKCLNCEKELNNIRAKYCSDKCRMAYSRRTNNPNKPDPNTDILPEQKQPEQLAIQEGICHGCGRKIIDIKEQWVNGVGNEKDANNICICLPCVQKGITHKGLGLDIRKCDKI
jgi:hypothetical protein